MTSPSELETPSLPLPVTLSVPAPPSVRSAEEAIAAVGPLESAYFEVSDTELTVPSAATTTASSALFTRIAASVEDEISAPSSTIFTLSESAAVTRIWPVNLPEST